MSFKEMKEASFYALANEMKTTDGKSTLLNLVENFSTSFFLLPKSFCRNF